MKSLNVSMTSMWPAVANILANASVSMSRENERECTMAIEKPRLAVKLGTLAD